MENNSSDDQADDRITIVLETPGRQPNDKPCRDDSDIAQGIANYMQDQSFHIHGASVRMAM